MKIRRVLGWGAAVVTLTLLAAGLVAYWKSGNSCDDPGPLAPSHPIKAAVHCDYGSPDVVVLTAIEKPVPADSELLVRVRAASVNPLDWHSMRGTPYLARFVMGLRKPETIRLGVDFSGTVESVGRSVTRFKPGDEVFGGKTGAFAEYLTIRESGSVVLKPANLTFEQAASVPVAAITALQGLRDKGQLQPGQKVLINGASGGVGTFAVQIAKAFGAEVTGVTSTKNVALVRSIGADQIVDYTKDNFTTGGVIYDVILDNVGNHSLSAFRRVIALKGKYVMVGGPAGRWVDPMPRALGAVVMSRFVSQDMAMFIADLNQKDLAVLADLMAAGKVTPVIDRQYKLSEIAEAIRYLETGRARGKVVITVE